tara:strand:- start:1466 stop:2761 length:1296 start_codon:yes stop_codon:yes gene_type:complete
MATSYADTVLQRAAVGGETQRLQQAMMQSEDLKSASRFYEAVAMYYADPSGFSNEAWDELQVMASTHGIRVPANPKDKATTLENIGAATMGVVDSIVLDLIPDSLYSSRRTETARMAGQITGLVGSVIATFGGRALLQSGMHGLSRAGGYIAARLGANPAGAVAMRGAMDAAQKVGGSKAVSWIANNMTLPGILNKWGPSAVTSFAQLAKRFGYPLTGTLVTKATARYADDVAGKLVQVAKSGSVDDVVEASSKYGDDVIKQAKESLRAMGKTGDDVAVDIAMQGTKVPKVAKSKVQKIIDKVGGVSTKGAGDTFDPTKVAQMSMWDDVASGAMDVKGGRKLIASLQEGITGGKSIGTIITDAGLTGKPAKTLRKIWKDPKQRKDLLKLMAETGREQPGAIGDVINLIGAGAFGGFMGYDAVSASTAREGF